MALRLGRSYCSYCGRVRCLGYGGRLFNRFRRHLPCGARFRVVLLEAAVFVLCGPSRNGTARCVPVERSSLQSSNECTATVCIRPRVISRVITYPTDRATMK